MDGAGRANSAWCIFRQIPTDVRGLTFSRTPQQLLNILFLGAKSSPMRKVARMGELPVCEFCFGCAPMWGTLLWLCTYLGHLHSLL